MKIEGLKAEVTARGSGSARILGLDRIAKDPMEAASQEPCIADPEFERHRAYRESKDT